MDLLISLQVARRLSDVSVALDAKDAHVSLKTRLTVVGMVAFAIAGGVQ